ncbi:exodeoxyribonuclease VII large subunit [Pseudacidovorax sp. RU35E]|uniref:exodeoxyribonuclease VII large subunit n=1 Tax=Pseudacidovorax sp. RU35E TaxID=1907403 RepID=UPI000953A908|nr:exodeoxyribonuclease VII large subunit [Pseudacidovorax sp. RU35E]SIR52796.1 Exodeoxyribonuclease VII large subunit [Pseudacidovorax sp. RU35E]
MPRHYLNVPFAQKDAAKSLGARFDGAVKRWYVEDGRDLTVFAQWLPASLSTSTSPAELALPTTTVAIAVAPGKGISLSRLLGGVADAVAHAFDKGVWTLVEVVEARVRGHVYLELSERDGSGQPIAKARGVIWSSTASRILPEFEKATGAVIGAGIKLLVRARPVFDAQYGFRLNIDAIDPDYTLGDLEARKKEIRDRLQKEGVFDQNRWLAPPWDYRTVVVIAPEDGAGLGDFRKEAERLERFGICRFIYAHSRFQGEGAAREIVSALALALERVNKSAPPDAIALIRGGGAVNDLAWLNDYDLVRFICDLDIPVLTGIGHERDNTLPDEVAHIRFDTPSKVIAGIEQHILRRVREASRAAQDIFAAASRIAQSAKSETERYDAQVRADVRTHLSRARQLSAETLHQLQAAALHQIHDARVSSTALLHQTNTEAARHVSSAQQQVPALMNDIRVHSQDQVGAARSRTDLNFQAITAEGGATVRTTRQSVNDQMQRLAERAQGSIQQARAGAEALMREVTGQGPEKTLSRGFAIVRAPDGQPVTGTVQAQALTTIDIQFRDGRINAQPAGKVRKTNP